MCRAVKYAMEDSEDIDELEIASKAWQKSVESAKKGGYREGVDAGSESILQAGFDTGYAEAFKVSFALGQYKALMTTLPEGVKIPEEIEEILSTTRRGACVLCKTESQTYSRKKMKAKSEKSLEDVIKAQREHSLHTIRTLHEYLEPLFKKHNLNIEDLPHPDKDL